MPKVFISPENLEVCRFDTRYTRKNPPNQARSALSPSLLAPRGPALLNQLGQTVACLRLWVLIRVQPETNTQK
jgi:hypothetical protein